MNSPSPAIVAQGAVRRIPRVALWLFALAYVLPGFIGREPWKSADMTAFGYMLALAQPGADWLAPQLLGMPPVVDGLLPYWLGAAAMQIAPAWVAADFAARVPFALLLGLTLIATWYGTYYLGRSSRAQPVAFAFGGEAKAPDYARAIADGALLALIACLGLAQLSHETTPAATQLCFTALAFYGFSALPYKTIGPLIGTTLGLAGLTLSGAPSLAVMLGMGSCVIHLIDANEGSADAVPGHAWPAGTVTAAGLVLSTVAAAVLASMLGLWRWRIEAPDGSWWGHWRSVTRLLLWFCWPAWPLALWTIWRWRRQILQMLQGRMSRHLALPLLFVAVHLGNTLFTGSQDRALLLALPALAALAAFALPTLGRSIGALVDWFTLLFFTGCAGTIWVVWIAMQTGVPPQPAANVARLAPGFIHSFSFAPFTIAICASLAWAWLVRWRAGRHRSAIWKSLVLPAGGAALCWLLLMALWLPLLDFARSYALMARQIGSVIGSTSCVETYGLDRGQIAAFNFHTSLRLQEAGSRAQCLWLLVDREAVNTLGHSVSLQQWTPQYVAYRPSDRDDDVLLYRRTGR
jgi:4-amino-4-deoxy-L-arabinose transferase-like glycosyltransferase